MTFGARSTELRQNVWHNFWSENNKYFYVIPIWGSQGGNVDTRIFVHENTGSRQSHILHMKNTQNASRLHVKYAENFPQRLISDFARVERVVSASERRVQRGFQKLPGLHWDLLSSAKFPAGGSTGTWMGEIVESPIGQSITNAWLIHKWWTARYCGVQLNWQTKHIQTVFREPRWWQRPPWFGFLALSQHTSTGRKSFPPAVSQDLHLPTTVFTNMAKPC